jgi:hypothetical protein
MNTALKAPAGRERWAAFLSGQFRHKADQGLAWLERDPDTRSDTPG